MKARITCDRNHPLVNSFSKFFELEFYSRSTGFDLTNISHIADFANSVTEDVWTINLSRGMPFGGVNLLCALQESCNLNKIPHKVFNIGSYINLALLDMNNSSYDIEKAALKLAHRKAANAHLFFNSMLDSYLLNVYHVEKLTTDLSEYPHLNFLTLEALESQIELMITTPCIKELSVQYKEPGNHRINGGIGPVLPGIY